MSRENQIMLDWTKVQDVVPIEDKLSKSLPTLIQAKNDLLNGKGPGSEFTGWVHSVFQPVQEDTKALLEYARTVQTHSDAIVLVGIGGSLLGTQAVYQALTHAFAVVQPQIFHKKKPILLFAGHHLATDELVELLDVLDGYSPTVVVVSKSGTTTETALVFRILQNYLLNRYGPRESQARIIAITDPEKGVLRAMATRENWQTFSIPPSIGGRYSVFSAVGLFPLAACGIDVPAFLQGAADAHHDAFHSNNQGFENNVALTYAGLRNVLYAEGYKVECLCTWTPKLKGVSEWWKQLFGESDGKNHTGIFPAAAQFSTDLHSLGQYFQEGERILYATHLYAHGGMATNGHGLTRGLTIPTSMSGGREKDMGYLEGLSLEFIQSKASQGTFLAHADGKVPTMVWHLPQLSAFWLGYWLYTNMVSCAIGGYARGMNPFDQPGVEAYKDNMFALLGKPSHGAKQAQLNQRLERSGRLKSLGFTHHV